MTAKPKRRSEVFVGLHGYLLPTADVVTLARGRVYVAVKPQQKVQLHQVEAVLDDMLLRGGRHTAHLVDRNTGDRLDLAIDSCGHWAGLRADGFPERGLWVEGVPYDGLGDDPPTSTRPPPDWQQWFTTLEPHRDRRLQAVTRDTPAPVTRDSLGKDDNA